GGALDSMLATLDEADTGEPFRLAGPADATQYYAIDPFAEPTTPFVTARLLRPPFTVAARAERDGELGPTRVLTRPLVVDGEVVDTTRPARSILPLTPRATTILPEPLLSGAGVGLVAD